MILYNDAIDIHYGGWRIVKPRGEVAYTLEHRPAVKTGEKDEEGTPIIERSDQADLSHLCIGSDLRCLRRVLAALDTLLGGPEGS